jgi:hypothetical protein
MRIYNERVEMQFPIIGSLTKSQRGGEEHHEKRIERLSFHEFVLKRLKQSQQNLQ